MFLQNLPKKLSDFLNKIRQNIANQLDENFTKILKILGISGGFIVIVVVVIAFMVSGGNAPEIKKENFVPIEKTGVDINLLLNNEFVLPKNDTFDITTEYINFMLIKE